MFRIDSLLTYAFFKFIRLIRHIHWVRTWKTTTLQVMELLMSTMVDGVSLRNIQVERMPTLYRQIRQEIRAIHSLLDQITMVLLRH